MFDQYMGVIKALGFQFVPEDWGWCSGVLVGINQYTSLFSLLSCRFGGDCSSSFALPDLRGRSPMGYGMGPGLTPRQMGNYYGYHLHALNTLTMAEHNHSHTYSGSEADGFSIQVAQTAGLNSLPNTGDYIAAVASGGTITNNLYLEPTPTPTNVAELNGVISGSGSFTNELLSIDSTPNPTEYVEITQASIVLNYCICMEGYYPSRS